MKAFDKLKSGISGLFAKPEIKADDVTSGWTRGGQFYDGAIATQNRSDLRFFPLSARWEMTRFNRIEILRKVRALEANLGLIRRMKGQVGKYSVGHGVFPVPQTSDADWNEQATQKFDDWAANKAVCDVAGAMTFWERQRFHAETFFAEGESFDALVSSSFSGSPQLQLFDNSEVGGRYLSPSADYSGFIDGVKPDEYYRPLQYLVAKWAPPPTFYGPAVMEVIDAQDMIHLIGRRVRANQLRAISPFAPGLNCAIDRMDLGSLITSSAKINEAVGLYVKKTGGEAGKQGISNKLAKEFGSDGSLTRVNENFFGSFIQYLKTDEEVGVLNSNRPTQNLVGWTVELIRDIVLGTELNFEIVWSLMELGGAPARIVLADAQWFFDSIQNTLNDGFNQRVWVWWCASMMKNEQLPRCRDPRWWICDWQGPPKLTADAARTAQAEIQFLHAGFNSWRDHYNQRGRAWKPVLQQRIDELAWAKTQCAAANIPLEYIFAPQQGSAMGGGRGNVDTSSVGESGTDSSTPGAAIGPQTINLSVDAKQGSARRVFKINRADGTEITGEIADSEEEGSESQVGNLRHEE